MNKMMNDLGLVRYATPEEIIQFEKVDALLNKVDEFWFDDIVVALSNYMFEYRPKATRKYYQRVYRQAKKLGVSTKELITWYCVESES